MLAILQGAGIILRRVVYATLVLALFLGSAVVGAAYRDSSPELDSRIRLLHAVKQSPRHLVQTVSEIRHFVPNFASLRGLGGDITQLAKDIDVGAGDAHIGSRKPEVRSDERESSPQMLPASAKHLPDRSGQPDLSLEKPIIATLRHDGVADPLSWLSDSTDCQGIRNGMNRRYGPVRTETDIVDMIDREEFRHVADETCGNAAFAECGFEWCGTKTARSSASGIETEPSLGSTPTSENLYESEARSLGVARARLTDVESSDGKSARPKPEAKKEAPDKRQPATRIITQPKKENLPVVVAKTKKPRREPSDAALAKTEVPNPMLGRYEFPEDSGDEPDDYRLILRKGNAGGRAVQRSQGY